MNIQLDKRHVIVTGGAGALGSSVVKLFLDHGATVSIPCLNRREQESFTLKEHPSIFIKPDVDLSKEKATQDFYAQAVDEQGPLWASIHLAGGFAMGSIEDTDLEAFKKQLDVNITTCYNTCRAALHWMRRSSFEGGRIVNVASQPALEPHRGKNMTAYTVGKAGVAALTQSLSAEVAGEGIWINAVAPSVIDTPANRKAMPKASHGSWPKPQEIAFQILCLASVQNRVTRGAVVPVYGKS